MSNLAKRIAALTLVISFFLPLSQCSVVPPAGQEHQDVKSEVVYAYSAYRWPSFGSFAAVAAFVWPLLFAFRGNTSTKILISGLELLLCAGTGFMLAALTYVGSWLFGAYLAALAICTYFLATVSHIFMQLSNNAVSTKT